jgi:hypothetical protein
LGSPVYRHWLENPAHFPVQDKKYAKNTEIHSYNFVTGIIAIGCFHTNE